MSESASSRSSRRGPTPRLLDFRSPHFWITQALVLLTIGAIYLSDASAARGAGYPGSLRLGAVALTMIPVLYAALMFGMEPAILTALWVVALATPMLVLGRPADLTGLVEPAILVVVLTIGTVHQSASVFAPGRCPASPLATSIGGSSPGA